MLACNFTLAQFVIFHRFMSNRGRQNVASLLTKDLYYDWRLGAEWFENLLIDYDPASNYGNVRQSASSDYNEMLSYLYFVLFCSGNTLQALAMILEHLVNLIRLSKLRIMIAMVSITLQSALNLALT